MKNNLIMHVNYGEISGSSFGSRSVDDICKLAANVGYDGIEFRANPPRELQALSFREYAEQIAAGKKKYGLSEILFNFNLKNSSSKYADERNETITSTIECVKIAQELCQTTVCNTAATWISSSIPTIPSPGYEFHGSAAATAEQWELTADTYRKIGTELEKLGVKFAFETHMGYIHDLPATAKKLVDMIDSPMVGINLDYGNTVYFPKRPTLEESIDTCGDKLFYTHLKNSVGVPGTNQRMPTALAEGEINHRLYAQKLISVGFSGPIGIEAPRPGDRFWYAKNDLAYFQSVLDDLA